MAERTPKDYAIEHAEYMAVGAEHLIEAVDALAYARNVEEAALIESCSEAETEARSTLRVLIYEFRKRRDRALTAGVAGIAQPGQHIHADSRLERAQQTTDAKFSSAASGVASSDASSLLADLTTLASEVSDHTPDSFRRAVLALAQRARSLAACWRENT